MEWRVGIAGAIEWVGRPWGKLACPNTRVVESVRFIAFVAHHP